MKVLKPSTQYKKDYKRIKNDLKKKERLFRVLQMLENEITIPLEYKPHMLTGNFSGYMECHVGNDFLLVWYDPDSDQIDLVRLGSHSEIFG